MSKRDARLFISDMLEAIEKAAWNIPVELREKLPHDRLVESGWIPEYCHPRVLRC